MGIKDNNSKSPNILNTSSNLLGFTFLILTSIKGFGLPQDGYVDEIVSASVVIFALSCLLSFMSMMTKSKERNAKYERIADFIFLSGLLVLIIVSILMAFNIIKFT